MTTKLSPQKIVILGAGVATFRLIRKLHMLGDHFFEITLIAPQDRWLWPETPSVAFGSPPTVPPIFSITELLEGWPVRYIQDQIDRIDAKGRQVHLKNNPPVAFDDLIFGDTPPLKQKTHLGRGADFLLSADGLRDLRSHLDAGFELLGGSRPHTRRDIFERVLIVGEQSEAYGVAAVIAKYQLLQLRRCGYSIIESVALAVTPSLAAGAPKSLAMLVKQRLNELGVKISLLPAPYARLSRQERQQLIGQHQSQVIRTSSITPPDNLPSSQSESERISWGKYGTGSRTILVTPPVWAWQPGGGMSAFAQDPSGRLIVTANLQVHDFGRIWVMGPAAAIPEAAVFESQIAQADCIARNLVSQRLGRPLVAYEPRETASIVYLGGHQSAVAWRGGAIYGIAIDLYRRFIQTIRGVSFFPWYRLGRLLIFARRRHPSASKKEW